jgi:hypothetical protein
MDRKSKHDKQPQQATVHPETQRGVKPGVRGGGSSKASTGRERDARSGHDKDGNEEHAEKTPKQAGGNR